jgi:hypothetical protein
MEYDTELDHDSTFELKMRSFRSSCRLHSYIKMILLGDLGNEHRKPFRTDAPHPTMRGLSETGGGPISSFPGHGPFGHFKGVTKMLRGVRV